METRFGDRLRTMRTRANLSQRDLEERTGINFRDISKIEQGVFLPTPDIERRIRDALNWTPEVDAALDALDGLSESHAGEAISEVIP